MKITEINRIEDFLALENAWNSLLETVNHTVFSRWEWLSTWWKHFGNNKRLLILLAEEHNQIVAIAPLMYSVENVYGLRIGKIEFIGTPDAAYCDFILGEKRKECIKLFMNYLNNYHEKWSNIKFSDIPATSKSIKLLNGAFENSKRAQVSVLNDCPLLILPKSFDAFMNILHSNLRRNIRRSQQRLQEKYTVEFVNYSNPKTVEKGMNILFDLHQKIWMQKGQTGSFANSNVRSFYLDVAKLFSEKKMLGLYSLQADDNPVAIIYGYKSKSEFHFSSIGRNNAYSRFSVGNLLTLNTIKTCIEEDVSKFNFGRGNEDYKYKWGAQNIKNLEITVIKNGIAPQITYWLYRGFFKLNRVRAWLLMLKNRKLYYDQA